MIPIYRIFAPNFSTSKLFSRSEFLKTLLPLRFHTSFSLSIFIVPYHGESLMTKLKMLQLLSLVLVICWCWILMVLGGFITMFSSAFRPKSTLILLPLSQLPKGKSWSTCPHISMEELVFLAYTMSLLPNFTISIAGYFNSIVVSNNYRCSIPVRFVSYYWSIVEMDIFLAVFLPNLVVNNGIGILSR